MVPHLPWPRGEWLRDHWRWWPEWTSERPRVLWYLAFQHRPEVARFGARTSEELRRARCVDVVPDRWLHLTLCDIGFVDEVGPDRLDAAAEAVTEALGDQPPIRLTLGPVVTLPDAVVLAAGPVEELRSLQTRVRTATARAGIAVEGLLDDDFWPHVSLCYLNGRTDPELLRTVVEGAPDTATEVVTDQLTQAVVTRADGHYRWQARARIYLAPQEPQSIPACRGSTWWRAREHGRPHPG